MLPLGGPRSGGGGWRDADSSIYGSAHGSSGSDGSYIKVRPRVQCFVLPSSNCHQVCPAVSI